MSDKKKLKVVQGGKQEAPKLNGIPGIPGKLLNGKPVDPNMTLEVTNEKIEKLIDAFYEVDPEDTDGRNNAYLAILNNMRTARFLLPAAVNEQKQPLPMAIKNDVTGKSFMPIFTDKDKIPADRKSPAIINMPFLNIIGTALNVVPKADGVIINPFTQSDSIIINRPTMENILKVEKERAEKIKKAKEQPKEIKLSPEQYVIFERQQFEKVFLPKKLFENASELLGKISEEREDFIEAIYEESYREKRMYPYIAEDFSVMPMHISEEFTVTRIDMPTRDMMPGCSFRVYLSYNSATDTAKYFAIDKAKEGANKLVEISSERKLIDYGEAPVEGAELQMIIDLANDNGEDEATS